MNSPEPSPIQTPSEPATKECPFCKSQINAGATACPHCTREQPRLDQPISEALKVAIWISVSVFVVILVKFAIDTSSRPSTPEWSDAPWSGFIGVSQKGTPCYVKIDSPWDDAVPCLPQSFGSGRGNTRVSHTQLSPDDFADVWDVWEADLYQRLVRFTFHRTEGGPYKVTKIEQGPLR